MGCSSGSGCCRPPTEPCDPPRCDFLAEVDHLENDADGPELVELPLSCRGLDANELIPIAPIKKGAWSKPWIGIYGDQKIIVKFPFIKKTSAPELSVRTCELNTGSSLSESNLLVNQPLSQLSDSQTKKLEGLWLPVEGTATGKVGDFVKQTGKIMTITCMERVSGGGVGGGTLNYTFILSDVAAEDWNSRFDLKAKGWLKPEHGTLKYEPEEYQHPGDSQLVDVQKRVCHVKGEVLDHTRLVLEQLANETQFLTRTVCDAPHVVRAVGVVECHFLIKSLEARISSLNPEVTPLKDMLEQTKRYATECDEQCHVLALEFDPACSMDLQVFEHRMAKDQEFRSSTLAAYLSHVQEIRSGEVPAVQGSFACEKPIFLIDELYQNQCLTESGMQALTKLALLDSLYWHLRIQILRAVRKNVWQIGWMHGDLRAPNIVVDTINFDVKLIDFGLARRWDMNGDRKHDLLEASYWSQDLQYVGDAARAAMFVTPFKRSDYLPSMTRELLVEQVPDSLGSMFKGVDFAERLINKQLEFSKLSMLEKLKSLVHRQRQNQNKQRVAKDIADRLELHLVTGSVLLLGELQDLESETSVRL